eukprot:SAG31_NODE_25271_length_464_cov_1.490411_1_plen_123_part_10
MVGSGIAPGRAEPVSMMAQRLRNAAVMVASISLLLLGCCISSSSSSSSSHRRQQSPPSSLAGSWYGTLSYPASQKGEWLSHNVPFNLTIDPSGRFASVNWTVEHIPGTTSYCSHQHEDGLNVT